LSRIQTIVVVVGQVSHPSQQQVSCLLLVKERSCGSRVVAVVVVVVLTRGVVSLNTSFIQWKRRGERDW